MPLTKKQFNILFICTHNSARSILAEAIASTHQSGLFQGFSAGSDPKKNIHPLAHELAIVMGYNPQKLRSKKWDEFVVSTAPSMDFIITVCDNAAGELCPLWPGKPISAHWGIPDPSQILGDDDEQRAAFSRTIKELRSRIDALALMSLENLDALAINSIHGLL